MPQLLARPPAAPNIPLPEGIPNRPLGQDWLGDAVEALLGGVGIYNPLDPKASKATQLGGLIGAAVPLGMMGKLGRAAQDLKAGFTLPKAKNALSDVRMGEFLAAHGGTLAAPTAAEIAPPGIRAYHGSPHDFNEFSLAKIGTGEGAQAYGHGLYFAENPAVAEDYARMQLSGPANIAHKLRDSPSADVAHRLQTIYPNMTEADITSAIAEASAKGKQYEVNLKANPSHFLDWDKPLSQQSQKVQEQLHNAMIAHKEDHATRTGAQIYRSSGATLSGAEGSEGAAQQLQQAGIPGIKYLDQGSRGAGKGSSNYVVFDEKTIELLRKYGIALPLSAGAAATIPPRQKQGGS